MAMLAWLIVTTTLLPIQLVARAPIPQTRPGDVQAGLMFAGQRVTMSAGAMSADRAQAVGPARLCLTPSQICFEPPAATLPFGESPQAQIVQLAPDRPALLFTAVASGSGSGSLKMVALLVLRND